MTKAREHNGKHPHPSKDAATAHKWSMVRNLGHKPSSLTVYKCKYCQKWHVGHAKRRRRR